MLPVAALSSLFVTSTSPAQTAASERQPLPDTRDQLCDAEWSKVPVVKDELDRLLGLWSGGAKAPGGRPAKGSGAANAPAGKARTAPAASPPDRAKGDPNVVVFMVDDMRADELAGPWMRHTRKLIKGQGVTFANSFSPLPLCGPARASFLAGQYAHNTGVRTNNSPASSFDQFDDRNTLPVWLKRAGYRTAFLGKYINGYAPGSAKKPGSYVPPGWDRWYASINKGTYKYRNTVLSNNGKGLRNLSGQYQTNAYGRIGSQLVSQMAGKKKPFFLNLSFTAPHKGGPKEPDDPGFATPARLKKMRGAYDDRITTPGGVPGEPCNGSQPQVVSDKSPITPEQQAAITEVRRQRAESLATVDKAVQRVVRKLKKTGELKNTYVIFTSDNGYFLGEFRQRIGKKLSYEPSLRTPTIIRGPGIKSGITREQAFTTIDFAPTIAKMANARAAKNVDGKSLLRAAKTKAKPWKRPILTDPGKGLGELNYGRGVRMPGAFYAEYQDSRVPEQLFDLSKDPHENRNVVADKRYERTRSTMARMLANLRDCKGETCRTPWKSTR